jgi:hypothetical protein
MLKYFILCFSLLFISVVLPDKSFSFYGVSSNSGTTDGMISVNVITTITTSDEEGNVTQRSITNANYSSKLSVDNFYSTLEEYKGNKNVSKTPFPLATALPTVLVANNDVATYDEKGVETTYNGKEVSRTDIVFSTGSKVYEPDPCDQTGKPNLILTQKNGGSGTFHKASVSVKLHRENNPDDGFRISVMCGGLPFQMGGDKVPGATSSALLQTTDKDGNTICKWKELEPGYFQQPPTVRILDNVGSNPDENAKHIGKRFYSEVTPEIKKEIQFVGIDSTEYFGYLKNHPASKTFNMSGFYHEVSDNGSEKKEIKEECTVTLTIGLIDKRLEISGRSDDEYHKWMPIEKNNPDSKLFYAKAKLTSSAEVKEDTFYFSLSDVTNYRGLCSNYPLYPANSPYKTGRESDLVFSEKQDDPNVIYIDSFNVKTIKKVSEASVCIECRDFAAYGKLSVRTVTIADCNSKYDGKKYLSIPEDDNNNKIADCWEDFTGKKEESVFADEDKFPEKQLNNGDGITYFEEYRGFYTLEDISEDGNKLIRNDKHVRLDPDYKDIFICDEANAFKKYYSQSNAAHCNWHLVDNTMMIVDMTILGQVKLYDTQIAKERPPVSDYVSKEATVQKKVNDYENKCLAYFYKLSSDGNKTDHRLVNFNTPESIKIKELKGLYLMLAGSLPFTIAGVACFPPNILPAESIRLCSFVLVSKPEFTAQFYKLSFANSPTYGPSNPNNALINSLQFENTVIHEIGHAIGIRHHHDKEGNETQSSGVTSCAMRYVDGTDVVSGTILLHMDFYCTSGDNCFGQINIKCLK